MKKQSMLDYTISEINSIEDFMSYWEQNEYKQEVINSFFGNKLLSDIDLLDDPNLVELHKSFYVMVEQGDLVFGKVIDAPYFSKLIDTKNKKYFIMVDINPLVDEDSICLEGSVFLSNDFKDLVIEVKRRLSMNTTM